MSSPGGLDGQIKVGLVARVRIRNRSVRRQPSSYAQQDAVKPTVAIHAGRLIDVRTGRVTTNAYITIAKGANFSCQQFRSCRYPHD